MKHKNFTKYFNSLTSNSKKELAGYCDVSLGHLRNVAYGFRRCSAELAVSIEEWSNGEMSRYGLGVRHAERIWKQEKETA